MNILYSCDAKETVRRIRCKVKKERSANIPDSFKDGSEKPKTYPNSAPSPSYTKALSVLSQSAIISFSMRWR